MSHAQHSKAVSAPGKVLLLGGYLVLDREYTGLVFGLSARIHVLVEDLPTRSGVTLSEIIVQSPQFSGARWEYGYRSSEKHGGVVVTQLRISHEDPLLRNPFVETALSYALTYVSSYTRGLIKPASITILADNDYYSHPSADASIPRPSDTFIDFKVPLWEAHKTGLGSSAALVTAFTAAVLSHYLPEDVFSFSTDAGKRRLHNLAQAAHCAAQGKVGSGFDVASAVYGSCRYKRFSPVLLEGMGEPGAARFQDHLQGLIEEPNADHQWDTQISKDAVTMPKGIRLIMCDVDCGSKTPGMVKKMLAWRKEKPNEANEIWSQLELMNKSLSKELTMMEEGAQINAEDLTSRIGSIRKLVRKMSELSGVPVEPPEQTQLLDACSSLPGIIGGVVPGAGGFDAVALLIEDKEETIETLRSFLENEWKGAGSIGNVRMLDVREEMEGVRLEDPATYGRWL